MEPTSARKEPPLSGRSGPPTSRKEQPNSGRKEPVSARKEQSEDKQQEEKQDNNLSQTQIVVEIADNNSNKTLDAPALENTDDELEHEAKDEDSSDDEDERAHSPSTFKAFRNFFSFQTFGFHPISFNDIMAQYTALKQSYAQSHPEKKEIQKTKSRKTLFDIGEFQKTQEKQKLSRKTTTISRFRPDEPKWDGSHQPSSDLNKSLYRIPNSDPTGTVITSVSRDLAKDATAWKTTNGDRDLPEPTADRLSIAYQEQVVKHMNQIIKQVEKEYRNMPGDTIEKSNLKAKVGADLDNLIRNRDMLLSQLPSKAKKNQHNKGGKKNKHGGPSFLS